MREIRIRCKCDECRTPLAILEELEGLEPYHADPLYVSVPVQEFGHGIPE